MFDSGASRELPRDEARSQRGSQAAGQALDEGRYFTYSRGVNPSANRLLHLAMELGQLTRLDMKIVSHPPGLDNRAQQEILSVLRGNRQDGVIIISTDAAHKEVTTFMNDLESRHKKEALVSYDKRVLHCSVGEQDFTMRELFLKRTCPGEEHLPDVEVGDMNPKYSYRRFNYRYDKASFYREPTANGSEWECFVDLLPVRAMEVHLNETKTPLEQAPTLAEQYGFANLYIKDEGRNPTGSAKDRQSAVLVNYARENNHKRLLIASSGNAAVSLSRYAAKAGLECVCVVPQNTSEAKTYQLKAIGAEIEVRGSSYEESYEWALQNHQQGWNCTPGVNHVGEEGLKLIGFEIWEQLGYVPDVIVVPCGNGSLLAQLGRAFDELKMMGLIDRVPQLVGVQMKGAAPLKVALDKKLDYAVVQDPPDSQAEGIIASESYSSPKAVRAVRQSRGTFLEVAEEDLSKPLLSIARINPVLSELTSLAAFAALPQVRSWIGRDDATVVVINTANGSKDHRELRGMISA